MMLIIVLFVLSIIISFYYPRIKGWFGETVVSKILASLPKDKYITINNVMLKTEKGTTQIDHVIVSVYGIFVIETKNYKGLITGSEFADKWTKNMYGKKYMFYNPLKQNYGHVKTLETNLNLAEKDFIPIVVFSINSELRIQSSNPVIYTAQLKKTILSYNNVKFNTAQINEFASKIRSYNIDSKENRTKHVNMIRENECNKKINIDNNLCPKCGGKLVERKGKYGIFKGCSNFPKCRFILK